MAKSKPSQRLGIESLEDRLLMAVVRWEPRYVNRRWELAPSLKATAANDSLKLVGTNLPDQVVVEDCKGDGRVHGGARNGPRGILLEKDKDYLRISHSDGRAGRQYWHGYVEKDAVTDSFLFLGFGGKDYFHYIDTTLSSRPRDPNLRVRALGGDGDDTIYGGAANDILMGEGGNDLLIGGSGCDLLDGGVQDDRLFGDGETWDDAKRIGPTRQKKDADYLIGGMGKDKLYGWGGGDILVGGHYMKVDDLSKDELYGYTESDTFFTESFRDNYQEAKDYDPGPKPHDGDRLFRTGNPVRPPSHLDWLVRLEGSLHVGGPLDTSRFPEFREEVLNKSTAGTKDYPKLQPPNFEVVLPQDEVYQCTGASVGYYGPFSPGSDPRKWTPRWFDSQYRGLGFKRDFRADAYHLPDDADKVERVVLYAVWNKGIGKNGDWQITHAARQLADGTWLSKLDSGPLIRHRSLADLSSNPFTATSRQYGQPYYVYTRPRLPTVDCGCESRRVTQ